mmetsp:Transcript_109933/g.245587  ORF Transcript_109933/g.245587 Transcript_109933/m.245587 type:complete len:759 (+) Transcript_109933:84-2360(+)
MRLLGPTLLQLLVLAAAASDATSFLKRRREANPLLSRLEETLPPFDAIQVHHVAPAVLTWLREAKQDLRRLEDAVRQPAFEPSEETLLKPFRRIGEGLSIAYGLANTLTSVRDSPELRAAVDSVRPKVIKHGMEVSQSQALYGAFKALRKGDGFENLTAPQRRLVELTLQDFDLSGIGLADDAKSEFNNITQRLSALSTEYSQHVLDSTKSWKKWVPSAEALIGLPETPLQLAAEAAKAAMNATVEKSSEEDNGRFLLTLDGPSASAVLTYAEDRELRREVFLASTAEASELLKPDNTEVLREMLNHRQRHAELLGFKNFAELNMQQRMATREKADQLLEDLRKIAYPKAQEDLAELRRFAAANGASEELKQWDLGYWGHKQVKALFDIDSEALRPYFALDRCLQGLFSLANKMVGVEVSSAEGPKWHDDVQLFALRRGSGGNATAYVYLDLFTRPSEKRSGAWMEGLTSYDKDRGKIPVCAIVANLRPPTSGGPALLSFDEVHTLFHEFGHALQHMLTTQAEPSLSGTQGVEWDAVELPSQFMEYWLDECEWVVKSIAQHYKTGEVIPSEKLVKLKAASKHHAGMGMLGQLHLSILDLDLHSRPLAPGETPQSREAAVAQTRQTRLMPPLPEDRFLCHFSHIFAGGYAAGYYSYKWAEVLSADAFARFEEEGATTPGPAGLQGLARIGAKFADTVFAEGGGRRASEIFADFRGREPSTAALLRYTFGDSGAEKAATADLAPSPVSAEVTVLAHVGVS